VIVRQGSVGLALRREPPLDERLASGAARALETFLRQGANVPPSDQH